MAEEMSVEGNRLYSQTHEAFQFYLNLIKRKTAMDIGSNEGGFVDSLLNKDFTVHCFEPVPDVFHKLKAKYNKNECVICNNVGVSSNEYSLKGLTVVNCWTLSEPMQFADMHRAKEYVNYPLFDVSFTTVDSYCDVHSLDPGFIKIDVDGYEYRVLCGAKNVLKEKRPIIYFEYSFLVDKIKDKTKEMLKYIERLNYCMMSLDGKYVAKTAKEMMQCYPIRDSFDVLLLPVEVA